MNDQNKNRNVLSRREFLKTIGAAGMGRDRTDGLRGRRERRGIGGIRRRDPCGPG